MGTSLSSRGHHSAAPLTLVCLRDALWIPAPPLSILGVPEVNKGGLRYSRLSEDPRSGIKSPQFPGQKGSPE